MKPGPRTSENDRGCSRGTRIISRRTPASQRALAGSQGSETLATATRQGGRRAHPSLIRRAILRTCRFAVPALAALRRPAARSRPAWAGQHASGSHCAVPWRRLSDAAPENTAQADSSTAIQGKSQKEPAPARSDDDRVGGAAPRATGSGASPPLLSETSLRRAVVMLTWTSWSRRPLPAGWPGSRPGQSGATV